MKNLEVKLKLVKEILLTNVTNESKMNQIGDYFTSEGQGISLGNTNLGDVIDNWFDKLITAEEGLKLIKELVFNTDKIVDRTNELV